MANTYGGESWNKKLARAAVLSRVRDYHYGNSTEHPTCMVLSGPHAADVRCLRSLGVPPGGIVAVDTDPLCVESARAVEPGCVARCMDAVAAARLHRGAVDVLVLDLCSQLNEASVDLFARVACVAVKPGGVAVAAFSYGRETGPRWALIQKTREARFRLMCRSFGMIAAREDRENSAKSARMDTFSQMCGDSFLRRRSSWRGLDTSCFFYTASKDTGAHTPMVYFVGTLQPRPIAHPFGARGVSMCPVVECADGYERPYAGFRTPDGSTEAIGMYTISGGEEQVRKHALKLRDSEWSDDSGEGLDSTSVGDRLNLDRGRVAAWFAVDTMQKKRAA
jgi:hypothetical protein